MRFPTTKNSHLHQLIFSQEQEIALQEARENNDDAEANEIEAAGGTL